MKFLKIRSGEVDKIKAEGPYEKNYKRTTLLVFAKLKQTSPRTYEKRKKSQTRLQRSPGYFPKDEKMASPARKLRQKQDHVEPRGKDDKSAKMAVGKADISWSATIGGQVHSVGG
jgi:hypothetical protein